MVCEDPYVPIGLANQKFAPEQSHNNPFCSLYGVGRRLLSTSVQTRGQNRRVLRGSRLYPVEGNQGYSAIHIRLVIELPDLEAILGLGARQEAAL